MTPGITTTDLRKLDLDGKKLRELLVPLMIGAIAPYKAAIIIDGKRIDDGTPVEIRYEITSRVQP